MTRNPYLLGDHLDRKVVVPGPLAAWLYATAELAGYRGEHPAADALIAAFEVIVDEIRRRDGGTAAGTRTARRRGPRPGLEAQVSTATAARTLGMTERGVRKAAEAGRLVGEKVDGRWRFAAASVRAYRDSRTA